MPKVKKQKTDSDSDIDDEEEEREYALTKNDFRSSTKLTALVKHLERLSKEQPDFKALVFSHFTVRHFLACVSSVRRPLTQLDASCSPSSISSSLVSTVPATSTFASTAV